MKTIELTKGQVTQVDDADYDWLTQFTWCARWQGNRFYATTSFPDNGKTVVLSLHTLMMMPDRGEVVDHINGDSLDNRRENLRVCSQGENLRNRRGYGKSKHKYVYYRSDRPEKPWIARFGRAHLGSFATEDEAAEAVRQALIGAA